jgi:DNA-binding CsgD family transcriptional regulator
MKHIDPELTEKVRELALAGTTIREIAEQLSISDNQAYSILKSLDIEAPWKVRRAKREAARAAQQAAAAAAKAESAVIPPSFLVNLYLEGQTLEEIGNQVGLSRERVRQLIVRGGFSVKQLGQQRKQAAVAEVTQAQNTIAAWVESHKGCTLEEIEAATGYSVDRIRKLLNPRLRHLILRDADELKQEVSALRKWSEEQTLFALRQAAKRVSPLTREAYDGLIKSGVVIGPVGSGIVHKFDSWVAACEAAGVQPGEAVRDNYQREFAYGDLKAALIQFISESDNLSVDAYDKWESLKEGLPSSVLIRVRYGTWQTAWRTALKALRKEWESWG